MTAFSLTRTDIEEWSRGLDEPQVQVIANAVAGNDVDAVALSRPHVVSLYDVTETRLDSLPVTDQKRSGRCWMFAALNVLRHRIAEERKLEDFEFSEAYLQFYDLLGKAEVFWDRIQEHRDDLDSREAHLLLQEPVSDGGEWNFVVALVEKYGLVPKYAMPETWSSSKTAAMVRDINTVLRRGFLRGRAKEEVLQDVRRILSIHLGEPPERFTWQYRDKDKNFHREGEFTPTEFAAHILPVDLGEYVVLGHDPRPDRAWGERYAIDGQCDLPGTEFFTYLNVSIEELSEIAQASLRKEEPVWFACDVMRQFSPGDAVWDAELRPLDTLYGVDSATTKAEQMMTQESRLTHAMVFTGYDDAPGPRWRVENSWGTEHHGAVKEIGDKGYGTMSQNWFEDNVFAIAVRRSFLPEQLRERADAPAHVVPLWDAMA
ncbi:aminopeptidase [Corynebacterium uropygiale]|uniref:Aminopeptidase n=1 Tax=Corynebacterium uropygiale TaxID=1775911 RepID=A0A9X1QN47_9CORY|nr:C1 family peptidase [Corynebacterium uropygiale]MCF4005686.1 aminopeptidase [Corynebacterium uropygiale]